MSTSRNVKRRRYSGIDETCAPQPGDVMIHPRKEWLVLAVVPNDRCRWPHMWDCSCVEVPAGGDREAWDAIRAAAAEHGLPDDANLTRYRTGPGDRPDRCDCEDCTA